MSAAPLSVPSRIRVLSKPSPAPDCHRCDGPRQNLDFGADDSGLGKVHRRPRPGNRVDVNELLILIVVVKGLSVDLQAPVKQDGLRSHLVGADNLGPGC
jgi:hypothetical protein